MKASQLLLIGAASLLFASCQDDLITSTSPFAPEERVAILNEFNEDFIEVPTYTSTENLPTHFSRFGFGTVSRGEDNMIHLGRALFYDTRLSADLSVSCASCHDQAKGFADDKAFSDGIEGRSTARNSQTINNIRAYYGDNGSGFFWDARATSLEDQAEQTMGNPDEMGMSLDDVADRLRATETYPILFDRLANDKAITNETITTALAAFTRNISSTGSKFDKALDLKLKAENNNSSFSFVSVEGDFTTGSASERFTDEENAGKSLYLENCQSCHSNQLPTRLGAHNNGLYPEGGYEDKGVGAIAGNFGNQDGWFKTPQLRNVGLTAPYMHNGSVATLEEVVDHYSEGIENRENLSPELKRLELINGKRGFGFSEQEKRELLAFLHTLTDTELVARTELSSPMKS
ncbi:MAG: cytochrome-c peroxidase [Saprospiraceae bacterium]